MNVQKNLDWVWRLFFYSPDQPLPGFDRIIRPVVDVTNDWPQRFLMMAKDYVTIAGQVDTIWTPPADKHWIIEHWSIEVSPAAAGDALSVQMLNASTAAAATISTKLAFGNINGATTDIFPLVGTVGRGLSAGVFAGNSTPFRERMYLPAGFALVVNHSSVLGATNVLNRMVVREYPSYQPLPLSI